MSSSKSFFKVILCSTIHDHILRIPDTFVKNYGDELSDLVSLIVPTGDMCCVKVLEKSDKTIWLQDGLQKFMEDHSIKFGYFLIFDYGGNSIFNVRIYDLTAMEIQYPCSTTHDSATPNDENQLPISDPKENDDDDDDSSIELLGSSTDHDQLMGSEFASGTNHISVNSAKRWKPNRWYLTRSKKKKIRDEKGIEATNLDKINQSNGSMHKETADGPVLLSSRKGNRKITSSTNAKNSVKKYKSVGSITSSKDCSEKSPAEIQENQATQAANMNLPKYPCYMITMKAYNICKNNLVHLPIEFSRLYLSCTSQSIKLQDADDNEWEVRCNVSSEGRNACHLTKGWPRFVRAKNLMVGDVCVFEPIQINEEVKLKVNIRRAVESIQQNLN